MEWLVKGHNLRLSDSEAEAIYQNVQFKPRDKEAGGLLLGRDLLDSNTLVIDKITQPFPNEKRSRYRCHRGKQHMLFAEKYWKQENSTGQILGLWHTHPESEPTPSPTDIEDWKNQLRSIKNTSDVLVFFIIGFESIGCWYGCLNSNKIHFIAYQPTIELKNE
jgi:integrative and conjugative element protein (TIGR02256 family)